MLHASLFTFNSSLFVPPSDQFRDVPRGFPRLALIGVPGARIPKGVRPRKFPRKGPVPVSSPGQQIVVQGVFDTYEEDGNRFVHGRDAILSFRRLPAP